MGISSKCVQVPIPSAMHDLAPAIIEASLSTSDSSEGSIMSILTDDNWRYHHGDDAANLPNSYWERCYDEGVRFIFTKEWNFELLPGGKSRVLYFGCISELEDWIHNDDDTIPFPTDVIWAKVQEATQAEAKEAIMSNNRKCESYKKNTDVQCGNGGPRDIHHNDHRHHVCGQHMESDRFVNCDKAEKLHKVEQPTLSLPNTDGLTAIQKLKEQMESAVPNPTKEEAMATLNTNPKLVCVFGERFDINKDLVLNHLTVDTDEKPCLYNRIKAAIGEFEVVSGGASGADFIGAKAAKIMGIPFHLVVPHPGYHEHYLKQGTHISDDVWSQMLESAKSVTYSVSGKVAFHGSFNNKRNEDMAKMAEYFVVISKLAPIPQSKLRYGGTKNMLNTLKARGVTRVYWINSQNGLGRWMATS